MKWDSLLVAYLARELDSAFARARIRSLRFDPAERVAALETEAGTVVFELHPERGWARRTDAPPVGEELRLARQPKLMGVSAPPDERVLIFALGGAGASEGRARRLIVELMGNQWNALALDARGVIMRALWTREAGGRRLAHGAHYEEPAGGAREEPGSLERWRELLGSVEPRRRARELVRAVAWTSPVNAGAVLGEAGRAGDAGAAADAEAPAGSGAEARTAADPEARGGGDAEARAGADAEAGAAAEAEARGRSDAEALEAAWERYRALATLPEARPGLVHLDDDVLPYPLPLPGLPHEPTPTLLDAFARVVEAAPSAAATGLGVEAGTLERLEEAVRRRRARVRGLRRELQGAGPEAEALRAKADLLLARLHQVRKGEERVELDDFAGGTVEVELDPALSPAENATRYYDEAKKRERAAERLPAVLARAREEARRLGELLERVEAGETSEAEVLEVLGPAAEAPPKRGAPPPPYRRYRTSGGLEVRVGRNRRANDDLTFHHSSPDDVWMHARDVGGAHVVLRWPDADNAPPARDIAEAAVLAALHSKARTSGTVPVDWTRRKYVRKPRKAPPGLVTLERVKTVFVEPDEAVEKRMRVGD